MPSLVATTSALARKPCVRTHYVRTNVKNIGTSIMISAAYGIAKYKYKVNSKKCKGKIRNIPGVGYLKEDF